MAYAYAGAAAYLAHCLDKHQKLAGLAVAHRESAGWIEEAKAAFRWAEAQRDTSQETRRKRQLAAVCLYLVTGDDAFQAAFREEWQGDEVQITAIAYDRRGESSLPTAGGETTVRMSAAAAQ